MPSLDPFEHSVSELECMDGYDMEVVGLVRILAWEMFESVDASCLHCVLISELGVAAVELPTVYSAY